MDFQYERQAPIGRPGTEHLRQAIVCLPLGLIALVVGGIVADSDESLGMPLVLLGAIVAGVGFVRLLQGLWQRVA